MLVGPPPGLAQPQVSGSAKQARVYSRSSLLALSQSPHVQTPSNLPPLQAWYGYVHAMLYNMVGTYYSKAFVTQRSPNPVRLTQRMGVVCTQTTASAARPSAPGRRSRQQLGRSQLPSQLPKCIQTVRWKQVSFSSCLVTRKRCLALSRLARGESLSLCIRRADHDACLGLRFRRHEDREAPDGLVRINGELRKALALATSHQSLTLCIVLLDPAQRKIPPSGKNPFGQVSSSGTFRPAGGLRDGLDSPVEERKRVSLICRILCASRQRRREGAFGHRCDVLSMPQQLITLGHKDIRAETFLTVSACLFAVPPSRAYAVVRTRSCPRRSASSLFAARRKAQSHSPGHQSSHRRWQRAWWFQR